MTEIVYHCDYQESVDPETLTPHPRNPNTHPERQMEALIGYIRRSGWRHPIIVSRESGFIVAGHARRLAAMVLGCRAPVEYQSFDSDADEVAFLLADNRLAELADMDGALLATELDYLGDLGYDVTDIGYDLDGPIEDVESNVDAEPQIDRAEELREKWQVETGQLWLLGDHRLLCGDCTKETDVSVVIGKDNINICLTDPPYGIGVESKTKKNKYDVYEDTTDNLESLTKLWLPIARRLSPVVVFSCGVQNMFKYPEPAWCMSWNIPAGHGRGPWGFCCWQPFLCYGKDPSLAGGNGSRPDMVNMMPIQDKIGHPCSKPVKLWTWFIERLSFGDNDIFYEPFSGSGTTVIACEQLGRKCRAIEISPGYVAVTLERYLEATGKTPTLEIP